MKRVLALAVGAVALAPAAASSQLRFADVLARALGRRSPAAPDPAAKQP